MSPWKWRISGLGGGLGVIAIAGALSLTPVDNPAKAASPVCFTTPAGCYCIDFFLTDIKEMITNKGQAAIQEKIKEQAFYKNYGIAEFSPEIGVETLYNDVKYDKEYRETFTKPFADRAGGFLAGADGGEASDWQGSTRNGKERIASRIAAQQSASLVPYKSDRDPATVEVLGDEVSGWADRVMLESEEVEIPSDEELVTLSAPRLFGLYDRARHDIQINHSRRMLQELGMSQRRLKALEKAREAVNVPTPVIGATVAAQVHSKMLITAIKVEEVKSLLRREAGLALTVGLQTNLTGVSDG